MSTTARPARPLPPVAPGPKARTVTVTPDLARQWLERPASNRRLSDRHVSRLSRDMRQGKWRLNGETIKLDVDGRVIDGQHRLWAVLMAETPVEMMVVEGLPVEVMDSIDTGRNRSFANVLQIEGTGSNAAVVAAVARLWYGYETGSLGAARGAPNASHADLREVLERHASIPERVREYVNSTTRKLGHPAAIAFVYSAASEQYPEEAAAWLAALGSGANLSENNPALRLRERLLTLRSKGGRGVRGEELAALAVKSWNAWLLNKPVYAQAFRYRSDEKFPEFAVRENAPAEDGAAA